jgi:AcrR family transcriptional regulator
MNENAHTGLPATLADDAIGTRQALLNAGRQVFAERGYDGASVRAITAEAGANLGAITYHFGTKEAFYDAVIDSTIAPFVSAVLEAVSGAGTPLDRIEAGVRSYFGYLWRHPEIPRLILQSVVAGGMPPAAALRHLQRLLGALVALVVAGQAEGTIREGDAAVMGLGIVSQSLHLVVMRAALRAVGGLELEDEETRLRLVDQLVEFVRAGLSSREGRT